MSELNMVSYFLTDRIGDGRGEHPCVLFGEMQYSYDNVIARTRGLASYLQSIGLRREERVLIILPDVPAFVWSLFGVLGAGGVVAMANPAAPADTLEYLVDYTNASVLITTASVESSLRNKLDTVRGLRQVLLVPETETGQDCERPLERAGRARTKALVKAVEEGAAANLPLCQSKSDDLAMWLFTSGSTGKPKAAVHCHRDFIYNTECFAHNTLGYKASDITVSVPRLYFGYATGTNLFFPFSVGATTCLYAERPTPQSLCAAVARHRPTVVTNVPTMLAKLLAADHDGTIKLDFSSVRFQLSAGEALPAALYEKFQHKCEAPILDGIGSAEMFHIYLTNRHGDVKIGSLGKPVEGYDLKILPADADGPGAPEVAEGESGVLWVGGDSVALCYHGDRDKSWKTFWGRWCRTGDLFRRDQDGYYYFLGRADDLFKVSGKFVAPKEIEDSILGEPGVAQATVVPVECEGLIKPAAFVVLTADAAPDAIAGRIQERVKKDVAMHAYPRWVEILDELPKNDRGKVDKSRLRERAKDLADEA